MKKKILKITVILGVLALVAFISLKIYINSINIETTHEAPKTISSGEQTENKKGVTINKIDHLTGEYNSILDKSSLFFEVGGTTPATGKFTDYAITLKSDSLVKELNVVIQTKSINTTNSMRDEHLREADFFDVATYPTVSFSSTSITEGDTSLIATGIVNFLGKDYDLVIPFKYIGTVEGTENTEYFEGKFEFDRVKMGMKEDLSINNIVIIKFFCELKRK